MARSRLEPNAEEPAAPTRTSDRQSKARGRESSSIQHRGRSVGETEAAEVVQRLRSEEADAHRPKRGSAVPSKVIEQFERSTGADLSDVTFTRSASNPHLASARGTHIDFDSRVDPSSAFGAKVLGHEVAHVLQARAGKVPRTSGQVRIPSLETQASSLGNAMATARDARTDVPNCSLRPTPISDGPEQGFLPLIGAAIVQVARGYLTDAAVEYLSNELDKELEAKRAEVKKQAWDTIEQSSPTAMFLLEWGPTLTNIWTQLSSLAAGIDQVLEDIVFTIMKNEAEGTPGLTFNESEARTKLAVLRAGASLASGVATALATDFYNTNMRELADTTKGVLGSMKEGQQAIHTAARYAPAAGKAVDLLHATSSMKNLGKDGTKLLQGKELIGTKTANAVLKVADAADKDIGEAEALAERAKAFEPDSDAKITADYHQQQRDAVTGAASAALLPAVHRAKAAFYGAKRRRAEGGKDMTAADVLSETHAAAGKSFAAELLTAALTSGGKLMVFKGALYMLPAGAATAKLLADASGPLFKLASDLNGKAIVDGMMWAVQNPLALAKSGLDGAKEWVQALLDNPLAWAVANPTDALALGAQKLAELGTDLGVTVAAATQAIGQGFMGMGVTIGDGAVALATGAVGAITDPQKAAQQMWDMTATGAQTMVNGATALLSGGASLFTGTFGMISSAANGLSGLGGMLVQSTTTYLSRVGALHLLGNLKDYALKYGLLAVPGVGSALAAMEAIAAFAIQHPDLALFLRDYSEVSVEHWGLGSYAQPILNFYDVTVGNIARADQAVGTALGKGVALARAARTAVGGADVASVELPQPPAAQRPANAGRHADDPEAEAARDIAKGLPPPPPPQRPADRYFVTAQDAVERVAVFPSAFVPGLPELGSAKLAPWMPEADRVAAHEQRQRGDVESLLEVADQADESAAALRSALKSIGVDLGVALSKTPPEHAIDAATSSSLPIAPVVAIALWYVIATVAREQSRRLDV